MDHTYTVTEATRKLWAVEVDLLEQFKAICGKYHLKWYALGGTLLGAARHQGFIPWDDDIDLALPYEDYRIFLLAAQKELEEPYSVHYYYTDPVNGGIMNARIRRSDTTGVSKWEYDNIGCAEGEASNYNMGIWIDVFPLCNVPETDSEKALQKEKIMEAWRAVRGYNALESRRRGLAAAREEYAEYISDYEKLHAYLSIGEIKALYLDRCGMIRQRTRQIGLTSFRCFAPHLVWEAAWFDETVELPFENTTVICPKYYDEVLTTQYGDWRTPVYNGACHEMAAFDAETPYKEFFRRLRSKNGNG